MTATHIPFQTQMRSAAMDLLREFGQDFGIRLSTYEGRPRSINPPHAFVDRMTETIVFDGLRQRTVTVFVTVIWGTFDSLEAVSQRDAFMDAFIDWVSDRFHAAGGETIIQPTTVVDDPTFVPDWLPPERQVTYFASTIALEGFSAGGY